MSSNREQVEWIQYSKVDSILCMDNSLRLLNDAYVNGISEQTKAALVELSLGEAAKSLLIYARSFFEERDQIKQAMNINRLIDGSFSQHAVKISAVKTFYNAIFSNLDKAELDSSNIYLALGLINTIMQEMNEDAKEDSTDLFLKSVAKENREELKSDILNIFRPLFSMSDKAIENVKNYSLYVNRGRKRKELIIPNKQNPQLITIMMLLVFVTGMLVYKWGGINIENSYAIQTFEKILSSFP